MSADPEKIALGNRLLILRDQGMTGQAIAEREGISFSQVWAAIRVARDAKAAEVREREAGGIAPALRETREAAEVPWFRLTEPDKRMLHKIRDEIQAADRMAMLLERRR